ncbi:LamG-like jellyroll fold domain-containing protein [Microbispora sp. NPDC046973]|uniref:LamG-like jellyroll fold domain-containing protein n=1 Tax=Microbispora sp. NPDC046973 TaxID=3155022 RepID=UPI0033CD9718
MSAPAVAQVPTPPAPAPKSETAAQPKDSSDPDLKAAWDKAAKSGKPVEVPARFTEKMKVWAQPDGKHLRAELSTRPVQLKNPSSGAWEPIDTKIVARGGTLQAARVKSPLTFGGLGAKHLVSAKGEKGTSGLGVTRALPEPKVSGSTVTYPDAVAPGADLVVIAQGDGFVSQVVFRRKPDGPVTVRLPLTLPEGTKFGKGPEGLPQLQDAEGKAAAAPVVLTAMDAKVEASPEQGRSSRVDAHVDTSGTTSELVFTPDEKFLADPAVTYPVTIAASSDWFGGGKPADAWVNKNEPYSNHGPDGWLRAGTTQTSADIARVYLQFDTKDPALEGATVNDADLIIWNYKSGGPNGALCGDPLGAGITVQRVTSDWKEGYVSWGNQPSIASGTEGTNDAGYNYDASGTWCAKDEALWHQVKTMVRAWIEQGVPNKGLMLRAVSETATTNWRQYYSSEYSGGQPYPGYRHPPTLMIEYEPPQVREFDIAYERDGVPDDTLPTYEELLENQIPLTDTQPEPEPVSVEEVAQRQEASDQTIEVDPETLPTEDLVADDPEPDSKPPTVVATVPLKGAVDVPRNGYITAFLSEPVTGQQITLKDASGAVIAGTMRQSPHGDIVDFVPAQPLEPSVVFTAEVSGATDAAGNTLSEPYTWSFTTSTGMASPTPSPTPTPTPTPTPSPVPGLVAAYGMEEGTGALVTDATGQNNNGTGSNIDWANGKYGKALSFNGTSSWVTVQDAASLRLTTGMTLSAWVNPATVTDWRSVLAKELSTEGVSYTLYASNGAGPAGWVQTSPEDFSTVSGTSPLPVNTWSHLALTYDGTALRMFVNGQQVAQKASSGSLYDDGSPLHIGGNDAWGEFFSGLIDEVRIYNRAQSAAEIQTDMSTPVGSTTPGPTPSPSPSPSPSPTPSPTPTPTPVQGLVAAYGMEQGAGTVVADSSGKNNTGTATDTTWTTQGKYGKALSFNGTSSWVTINNAPSLRLSTGMTLSAWVKPSTVTNYRSVIMKELSSLDGASYSLYASNGQGPVGYLTTNYDWEFGPPTPLPTNTWSHIAVTYDGTTARLFVNGTQAATAAITGGSLYDDGGPLHIGGNNVWGEYFQGLIDEVRIYNRAQTAAQIQTDMNTPVGIGSSAGAQALARTTAAADTTAPVVEKLAVLGSKAAGEKVITPTLTPKLAVWVSGGQSRQTTVEVEVANKPSKTSQDKRLIWSGKTANATIGSRKTLQIPAGKLKNGWDVRWRARATAEGKSGAWTAWRTLATSASGAVAGASAPNTQSAAAGPTTGPWPTWPDKRIKFEDCWGNNKANSKKNYPHGWVRDSYNWCSVRTVGKARVQEIVDECGCKRKVKGKIEFLFSVAGHTFAGGKKDGPYAERDQNNGSIDSRTMRLWARIDQIRVSGEAGPVVWPETTELTVHLVPATANDMSCRLTSGGTRKSTLAEWRSNPQQYYEYVSDKNSSRGPHKLSVCTFTPIIVAGYYPGQGSPFINTKMADEPVRCDTSEELKSRYGGCVFSEFTPTFVVPMIYEWKNGVPVMNESADLIRRALEEPKDTYPKKTDGPKVIPGAKQVGPIHRSSSTARDEKNRDKSRAYCAQMLAELKEPRPIDRDCDEFPFAATHEGSAGDSTNGNVAVDYIIWDHNQHVGRYLRWFFQDYRVFGSDPENGVDRWHPFERFYVKTPN